MSFKKILDVDETSGTIQYFHGDNEGNCVIETVQDIKPILAENAQIRSQQEEGWKGDWHHVARIPQVLYDQWWRELGSDPMRKDNRAWLISKLNSRDFSGLRTKTGNI